MTGVRFLAAFVLLPAVGAFSVLSRRARWMPAGAAFTTATVVGAVVLCAEMFALTVVGVRWNVGLLLLGPAIAAAVALRSRDRSPVARPSGRIRGSPVLLLGLAGAALLLVAYASLTARVTSTDLLLFWAHKGERFALSGGIDAAYLARPDRANLQSDYPPLWPCLYGFATLLAGRFAWGASLATLPLFLTLMVVAVWSFARRRLGSVEAAAAAAAFAAIFGFLLSDCLTAGNADPPLLFFETVALCLLVFARDEPGAFRLAGMALAAAAWLKLEGIAFGWAVIAATMLLSRSAGWKRIRDLALPPIVAYLSWIAFCASHGLIAHLGAHRLVLTAERFRTVVVGMASVASLGCSYLPWILAGALFVVRRPGRSAAIPVVVAILAAAFDCGIYFAAEGDPTAWIGWAGERTLLTPLLALLIAAMAPGEEPRTVSLAA